jgi:hypothetical protein
MLGATAAAAALPASAGAAGWLEGLITRCLAAGSAAAGVHFVLPAERSGDPVLLVCCIERRRMVHASSLPCCGPVVADSLLLLRS